MEKKLKVCRVGLKCRKTHGVINSNLNINLSKFCAQASLHAVKKVKRMYTNSPDDNLLKIGMYFSLVYQIETKGREVSYYHQIEKYMKEMDTRPPSSFLPVINHISEIY